MFIPTRFKKDTHDSVQPDAHLPLAQIKLHNNSSDKKRKSTCSRQDTHDSVRPDAQLTIRKSICKTVRHVHHATTLVQSETHVMACQSRCARAFVVCGRAVVCVLYLRVRHDAWACGYMLSACQSRCARFFGLRESPAVCVVCWLQAKHHVRVCVSVSIIMCMFLAAHARKSVRQSSRSSAKTNVNHMKSAVVDIVLGSHDSVTSTSWTRPCLRPSTAQRCKKDAAWALPCRTSVSSTLLPPRAAITVEDSARNVENH